MQAIQKICDKCSCHFYCESCQKRYSLKVLQILKALNRGPFERFFYSKKTNSCVQYTFRCMQIFSFYSIKYQKKSVSIRRIHFNAPHIQNDAFFKLKSFGGKESFFLTDGKWRKVIKSE